MPVEQPNYGHGKEEEEEEVVEDIRLAWVETFEETISMCKRQYTAVECEFCTQFLMPISYDEEYVLCPCGNETPHRWLDEKVGAALSSQEHPIHYCAMCCCIFSEGCKHGEHEDHANMYHAALVSSFMVCDNDLEKKVVYQGAPRFKSLQQCLTALPKLDLVWRCTCGGDCKPCTDDWFKYAKKHKCNCTTTTAKTNIKITKYKNAADEVVPIKAASVGGGDSFEFTPRYGADEIKALLASAAQSKVDAILEHEREVLMEVCQDVQALVAGDEIKESISAGNESPGRVKVVFKYTYCNEGSSCKCMERAIMYVNSRLPFPYKVVTQEIGDEHFERAHYFLTVV